METSSLLYRVFYDRTLAETYVRGGRGSGLKLFFLLAVFASVLTAAQVYFMASSFLRASSEVLASHLPDIEVHQGQIVAPENFVQSYVSRNDGVFIILDTTGEPFSGVGLPSRGIFISRDSFSFINRGEVSRVPLEKILGRSDFTMNEANKERIVVGFFEHFKRIAPLFVFLLLLPSLFLTYVLTAFAVMLLSYLLTTLFEQEFSFESRMRLSVLSLLPMLVLNVAARFLGLRIVVGLGLGALITFVYMFCLLKEGEKKQS